MPGQSHDAGPFDCVVPRRFDAAAFGKTKDGMRLPLMLPMDPHGPCRCAVRALGMGLRPCGVALRADSPHRQISAPRRHRCAMPVQNMNRYSAPRCGEASAAKASTPSPVAGVLTLVPTGNHVTLILGRQSNSAAKLMIAAVGTIACRLQVAPFCLGIAGPCGLPDRSSADLAAQGVLPVIFDLVEEP